jgi:tetratricopeptide (TPR) repeat protein
MLHESASRIGRSEAEDALPEALALLDRADSVLADAVGAGLPVQAWFQSGQSGYRRGRLLADAERYQEGLAELERAIAAYESGPGPDDPETEAPRAEAVRIAALVEGQLSRFTEARRRIAETVPRCRRAGLDQAVQVLGDTDARLAEGERESRRPQHSPEG